MRSVFEDALRRALEDHETQQRPFALRDASVDGSGPRPRFTPWHWDKLADVVYGDRDPC